MSLRRAAWRTDTTGVGGIAPPRLVFLDERGVLTNMARRHGRSPRGQRAHASVPFGNWKRLSVLGAIGLDGIIAAMSVEAATGSAIFAACLEQVLLSALRQRKPDAVLIMDNLRAHKTPQVQAVLDGSGFAYRYLPAYSPDFNPIEPGWAKVKSTLRRIAARTTEALEQALGPALDSISVQDATGYFRHCGYARLNQPALCYSFSHRHLKAATTADRAFPRSAETPWLMFREQFHQPEIALRSQSGTVRLILPWSTFRLAVNGQRALSHCSDEQLY